MKFTILQIGFITAALPLALFFQAPKPAPVTAISTNDFLNSIGVNSAISSRGESLDKTIAAIKYTGIRWIRSGYEGNATDQDYQTLHRETGIKFSYGLMSGGTDLKRLLAGGRMLARAGALLAFEGVNEPNNWPIDYKGEKGGKDLSWQAVAKLQSDLYKSVKADAVLNKYPVWSISEGGAQKDNVGLQYLQIPAGAGLTMPDDTRCADYATCHNYFLHPSHPGLYDNQTWNAADPGLLCKVDGLYGNYGKTWRSKFKGYTEDQLKDLPKVTTETGATLDGALTEEKQARLYLNLYLAQFKLKWSYTSIYLLRDRSDEDGNQTFGFYQKDYTPRKAAVYLHNFTTILADKGAAKKTGILAYTIPNCPETVHDLLLQNSNGKFQLVIWDEKANGSDEVKVTLGKKAVNVKVYDPIIGVDPVNTYKNSNEVTLTLNDHPVVIEL
ncbi:glycosyl hydrolase [Mucilaginibacter corticis]|uniref:Glycosyl hydrolase n=1 Tax=Mucilaginibacter corticis TaxID=2597670 RepID=A0A556MUP9_9SPHI|nr:glycosyl hydrolase [Mucilaginibacter corticis]TSJ43664.1 glycosyl hydrolase [Mucilaginibacter corticis]